MRAYNVDLGLLQRHVARRDRGAAPRRHRLAAPVLAARPPRQRLGLGRGRCCATRCTAGRRPGEARHVARTRSRRRPELREPLATLGLSWPTTLDAVKTRYKELAKRHHPDANGGDRAAEERLKTINLAYAAVRSRLVAATQRGRRRMSRRPSSASLLRRAAPGLDFPGIAHRKRWPMNKVAALAEIRPTSAIDLPDTKVVGARGVRHRNRHGGAGLLGAHRARPRRRHGLQVRPRDDARDPGRVRLQPPRDDPGLSRHRQVHPYRAGGGAAELALHPRQPRQPHQPHRPDRQGRDRPEGRQADHRIPRGHPALGAAARLRAGVRRIRRRPAGRDVRDPARAGGRGQADPARPEPGDPAASVVPAVLHRQHGGPRRHDRPVSRHAADQSGPDGPLEHRRHAELPAARDGDRDRAGEDGHRRRRTRR